MSEMDCKTYSVFETHPRATPKPSLTSRDHLHGRLQSRCCQVLTCSARTLYNYTVLTIPLLKSQEPTGRCRCTIKPSDRTIRYVPVKGS